MAGSPARQRFNPGIFSFAQATDCQSCMHDIIDVCHAIPGRRVIVCKNLSFNTVLSTANSELSQNCTYTTDSRHCYARTSCQNMSQLSIWPGSAPASALDCDVAFGYCSYFQKLLSFKYYGNMIITIGHQVHQYYASVLLSFCL